MNKSLKIECADIYIRFPEIMKEEANDLDEFLKDNCIVFEPVTKEIISLKKNKENLIKYLEEKIRNHSHEHYVEDLHMCWDLNEEIRKELQDVLERVKSGKYECK